MAQRKDRLLFFLLAMAGICLALACLMAFTTGGALALRRAAQSSQIQTDIPSDTLLPTATLTYTPIPTISATPSVTLEVEPERTITPLVSESLTPAPSLTSGSLAQDAWCIPWNSKAVETRVLRVIDGVTIEVQLNGETRQVRYIGIDLLEYDQDWRIWSAAKEKNKKLVEGKAVLLINDRSDLDDEGRLARYVIVDGRLANREMVASGYAIAQSMPPNTGCDPILLEAEIQAITAGRGLWAATPTPTRTFPPPTPTISAAGDVVIVKVAFRGTPWQEPEEFVEIYNSGIDPVQLDGWTVSDIKNHVFVFPNFILGPGQYCRVYTNLYSRHHCEFSYYSPSPIWENDGDCAYLKDKTGRPVDEFCYE